MAWCLFLRYKALNTTTCFLVKTEVGVEDRNVNDQNTWQSQWWTCFKCCLSARWVMAITVLELPKIVIGVVSSNEPEFPCGKRWKDVLGRRKDTWKGLTTWKRVKTALLEFACSCGTWWVRGSWWYWEGHELRKAEWSSSWRGPCSCWGTGCFYSRQWKINKIRCLYLITLGKSLLWLLSDKVWKRNNETIILHRRRESW